MATSDSEQRTRASLLVRLRDPADSEACETFFEVYAPLVYRHCRKHGLQDADGADLTQEVLAQVARSCGDFQYTPERGRFRDWLGTVTRRRIAALKQNQQGKAAGAGDGIGDEILDQLAAPPADDDWNAAFHSRLLQVSMDRIQPPFEAQTWQAFVLTWLEDRPAPDVAQELGLMIDQVYVSRSRVLKRLREEVLALAEDLPQFSPPE
jgi:RNA polymerase sigma-70 factor (ECF subfamily)